MPVAVTDEAVSQIRDLIMSGELNPGDQLPHEAALAAKLGLSRSSLREAIRALAQMRVLEVRHGSGTYVTDLDPAKLLEGVSFAVDLLRDDTLLEVLEVRQLLEPAATRLAVQRMTSDKLAAIRAAYEEQIESSNIEDLVSSDIAFHRAIVEAADNATLLTLLDGLTSQTVRMRIWGGVVNDNAVSETQDVHLMILKAIEAGDPHLAESWALIHARQAQAWLQPYLGTRE